MTPPTSPTSSWSPLAAYVLPFVVFGVIVSIEGLDFAKPWYPILYTIQTIAVLSVLWWGRTYYPAWSWQGIGKGLIAGLLGGVIWIILCEWNFEHQILPGIVARLAEWLNMPSLLEWIKPGSRVGYNPWTEMSSVSAAWGFTLIRLIGMIIAVPLMEEVFWRGFLNRFLIDENWQTVAYGRYTKWSFIIVTLAFVMVHTEWTAAMVWGIGINLVLIWTRNLWACVAAHGASNAVLAYYILAHGQWQLW